MNEELQRSRQLLACLGDESRFRVMRELLRGDHCVTELAKLVGLSQSCTTRHLQVLERVGLARSARFGKRVVFSIGTEPRVRSLLDWALPADLDGDIARWSAEQHDETNDVPSKTTLEPTGDKPEAPGQNVVRPPARDLEDFLL